MPQGLQVFDETGKPVVDLSYTTPKVVKIIDSGLSAGGYTPPFVVTGLWASVIGFGASMPAVRVDGNSVYWEFKNTITRSYKIVIGGQ